MKVLFLFASKFATINVQRKVVILMEEKIELKDEERQPCEVWTREIP